MRLHQVMLRLGRTAESVHVVDTRKIWRLNVACARSFKKNRWGIHAERRRCAFRLESRKEINDSELLLAMVVL